MRPDRATALTLCLAVAACGSPRTAPGEVPVQEDELLVWLEDQRYRDWSSESVEHQSRGAHMGWVRLWVDDALAASLEADNAQHPVGATAVMELYGPFSEEYSQGGGYGQRVGWAVSVKLADGEGWYEFHQFFHSRLVNGEPTSVRADREGVGLPECLDCHGAAADHVLTEWPLR